MSLVFPNSLAVGGKCIYLEGHHLNFLAMVGFVFNLKSDELVKKTNQIL